MSLRIAAGFLASGLWATACSSRPSPLPKPPPIGGQGAHIEGPYVAARSEFTIVLDTPIGTHQSSAGQRFSAHVEHPVRSAENDIVIQTLALVHGVVISVETLPTPAIKVRFTDIETIFGPAPLAAVVRTAEQYAWLPRAVSYQQARGYDSVLFSPTHHPAEEALVGVTAVGGGPTPEGGRPEVQIPVGATLRIALGQPIIPPRHGQASR